MKVAVPGSVRNNELYELLSLLASEVNVREIRVVDSDESLVRLRGKPNYRTLGKVYGKRTPKAAELVSQLSQEELSALEGGATQAVESDGEEFRYRPEDIVVEREVTTDWLVQSEGPYVAALDPHITRELELEGTARELVNRIQRLRKEAGYSYDTRVVLGVSGAQDVLAAAEAHRSYIARETLARGVKVGSDLPDPDGLESVDIDGQNVVISLKRYDSGQ
jgi:isoleucyl-tRNA synthetase